MINRDSLHEHCFGHQTFVDGRGSMLRELQLRTVYERWFGELGDHEELNVVDPDNLADRLDRSFRVGAWHPMSVD